MGGARAGTLRLPHGEVPTPAFMPVGTRGAVRGLHPDQLAATGAHLVLANTYHLWERPGHERIERLGGLHSFMGWTGPLLTDSGGYQVFSLREHLKLTEEGAKFRSPLDGTLRHLTPELAVEVQEALGVDVAMAFDECLEWPASPERAEASTARTTRWLHRCLAARRRPDRTALFGIVQGGMYEALRAAHAQELSSLDLDGYAIGGLSVGEGHDAMMAMVEVTVPHLPVDRVRYLMGVGHPHDIVQAVLRGVDLFDCVLPTRAGRHGTAYTTEGKMNLRNQRFADDVRPLDPNVVASPANGFSRAYLSHLVRADEILGATLLSSHNLAFYQQLVGSLREAIQSGDRARLDGIASMAARASSPAPHGA